MDPKDPLYAGLRFGTGRRHASTVSAKGRLGIAAPLRMAHLLIN